MKSGFSLFFRLVKRTLFYTERTQVRFTMKRFLIMSRFIPMLFLWQIAHWIGFLLDDIFFRRFRRIEVKEPVFIVGIPRSGTTFLHRILSEDTDNFTTFKLWELLFAPSITERKFWMAIGTVDRVLGGGGRKLLLAIDHLWFRTVRKIHKISLFEAEEDDLILIPVFASVFLLFQFPFPEELWHLIYFDSQTPRADRRRIMRFYKECVQRHLYVHGAHKRLLSKNPSFSSKIDALDAYFPDSKVVCCMRNPYNAVPSLLSFLSLTWNAFDNNPRGNLFRDQALELAAHCSRHPLDRLKHWSEDRHAFLRFDVITWNLRESVNDLYKLFGFDISPAFDEYLRAREARSRAYKTKHTYSLEHYALTPKKIRSDFSDIFEHFGFNTDHGTLNTVGEHAEQAK